MRKKYQLQNNFLAVKSLQKVNSICVISVTRLIENKQNYMRLLKHKCNYCVVFDVLPLGFLF